MTDTVAPDLILHHGLITTLYWTNPNATAVAIANGRFAAGGHDQDIMELAGPKTKVINIKGSGCYRGRSTITPTSSAAA